MESNKEARRVLNRHGVDLSYCQFSCAGSEIRMTGWLCKYDGSDFSGQMVEAMISDLQKQLPGISVFGDLDNWQFTTDHISFLGGNEEASEGNGGEDNSERYEIDTDEAS